MAQDLQPKLIISDAHGIYIPQFFCKGADEDWAKWANVDYEDVQICQQGPDHELYWEAWSCILDNAEVVTNGTTWRLYQDGDLWEVPDGYEWDTEV